MRRTPSSFDKGYLPIVIWLDDLERVFSILQSNGGKVEIHADNYVFESIDELTRYLGLRRPKELRLRGSEPYATVELTSRNANIYVSGDDSAAKIFLELDKFLTSRRRQPAFLDSWWSIWILNATNLGLGFLPRLTDLDLVASVTSFLGIVILLWVFWALFVRGLRHCLINLERWSPRVSFFERNKDKIVLAVISAAVGAALTFAVSKLTDKSTAQSPTSQAPQNNPR